MTTTTKFNIPFFNYPALWSSKGEDYLRILQNVLSKGAYILQQELKDFEHNLANFINVKHAFGVADGTNALIIALKAAGIGESDEVILPSHTYIATAASVKLVGATPVLVECGPDHMISPEAIKAAINSKTKAIMPVQLNGRTSDMDKICEIAAENNLKIIEDSAQALGSKFKDKYAGTFGVAGTFSFYPAKVLGCFGDGGAIVTNDDEVAEKISLLRDHGRNSKGEIIAWGTNSRLDNMQAAILDFKLKTYNEDIERRRSIARMYNEGLSDIQQLVLPPAPESDPNHFDVYQNYEIEADNREEFIKFLKERGIGTLIQWGGKMVHQLPNLGFDNLNLPVTEALSKKYLMLPMHTALSNEEVNYIIDTARSFYQ